MKFNHIHPIYKNETEEKATVTKKYERIYGKIIEQRKQSINFATDKAVAV